jgi:hypothetical protein
MLEKFSLFILLFNQKILLLLYKKEQEMKFFKAMSIKMINAKKYFLRYFLLNFIIFILIFCYYNSSNNNNLIPSEKKTKRKNGCILVLVANSDLKNLSKLIKRFELVFNKKYNYPYILFNDKPFTPEFKAQATKYTESEVEFGLIPDEYWRVPEWVDRSRLNKSVRKFKHGINYHQMCRFFSGFFFRHEVFIILFIMPVYNNLVTQIILLSSH